MKELQLLKEQVVNLEEETSLKLEYYLSIDESTNEDWGSIYGIQIIKRLDGIMEMEETGGISYSKELAVEILNKLFLFQVTPISMLEIVDDFLTEHLYS